MNTQVIIGLINKITINTPHQDIISFLELLEYYISTDDRKLIKQHLNLEQLFNVLASYYYIKVDQHRAHESFTQIDTFTTLDAIPIALAKLLITGIRLNFFKFPLVATLHDVMDLMPTAQSQVMINFVLLLLGRLVHDDQFVFSFGSNIASFMLKAAKVHFQASLQKLTFCQFASSALLQVLLLKLIGPEIYQNFVGFDEAPQGEFLQILPPPLPVESGEPLISAQFERLKGVIDTVWQVVLLVLGAASAQQKLSGATADVLVCAAKAACYFAAKTLRFALLPPGLVLSVRRLEKVKEQLEVFQMKYGSKNLKKDEEYRALERGLNNMNREFPGLKFVFKLRENCSQIGRSLFTLCVRCLFHLINEMPRQTGAVLGCMVQYYNFSLYTSQMCYNLMQQEENIILSKFMQASTFNKEIQFDVNVTNFTQNDIFQMQNYSMQFFTVNCQEKLPYKLNTQFLLFQHDDNQLNEGINLESVLEKVQQQLKLQQVLQLLYSFNQEDEFLSQFQMVSEKNNKDKTQLLFLQQIDDNIQKLYLQSTQPLLRKLSVVQYSENIDFLYSYLTFYQPQQYKPFHIALVISNLLQQFSKYSACIALTLFIKFTISQCLFNKFDIQSQIQIQECIQCFLLPLIDSKQYQYQSVLETEQYDNSYSSQEFNYINFIPSTTLSRQQFVIKDGLVFSNQQQTSNTIILFNRTMDIQIILQTFSFIIFLLDESNATQIYQNKEFYTEIINSILVFLKYNARFSDFTDSNFNYIVIKIINDLSQYRLNSLFLFVSLFQAKQNIQLVITDEIFNLALSNSFESPHLTYFMVALIYLNNLDNLRKDILSNNVLQRSVNFLSLKVFIQTLSHIEDNIQVQLSSEQLSVNQCIMELNQNITHSTIQQVFQLLFDKQNGLICNTKFDASNLNLIFTEDQIYFYLGQYCETNIIHINFIISILQVLGLKIQIDLSTIQQIIETYDICNYYSGMLCIIVYLTSQYIQFQQINILRQLLILIKQVYTKSIPFSNQIIYQIIQNVQTQEQIEQILLVSHLFQDNLQLLSLFLEKVSQKATFIDNLTKKNIIMRLFNGFYEFAAQGQYLGLHNAQHIIYEIILPLQFQQIQNQLILPSNSYYANLKYQYQGNQLSSILQKSIYQILYSFTNQSYSNNTIQFGKEIQSNLLWIQLQNRYTFDVRCQQDSVLEINDLEQLFLHKTADFIIKQHSRNYICGISDKEFYGSFFSNVQYLPKYLKYFTKNLSYGFQTYFVNQVNFLNQKGNPQLVQIHIQKYNYGELLNKFMKSLLEFKEQTFDYQVIFFDILLRILEIYQQSTFQSVKQLDYIEIICLISFDVYTFLFYQLSLIINYYLIVNKDIISKNYQRIVDLSLAQIQCQLQNEIFVVKAGLIQISQNMNQPCLIKSQDLNIYYIIITYLGKILQPNIFILQQKQILKYLDKITDIVLLYAFLTNADEDSVNLISNKQQIDQIYHILRFNIHLDDLQLFIVLQKLIQSNTGLEQNIEKLTLNIVEYQNSSNLLKHILPICKISDDLKTELQLCKTTNKENEYIIQDFIQFQFGDLFTLPLDKFLQKVQIVSKKELDYIYSFCLIDQIDISQYSGFNFQLQQESMDYLVSKIEYECLKSIQFLALCQVLFQNYSFDQIFLQIIFFSQSKGSLTLNKQLFNGVIQMVCPIISLLPIFSVNIINQFILNNEHIDEASIEPFVNILTTILTYFNIGELNIQLLQVLENYLLTYADQYEKIAILAGLSGRQISDISSFSDNIQRAINGDYTRDEGIQLKFVF